MLSQTTIQFALFAKKHKVQASDTFTGAPKILNNTLIMGGKVGL